MDDEIFEMSAADGADIYASLLMVAKMLGDDEARGDDVKRLTTLAKRIHSNFHQGHDHAADN